MGNRRAMVPHAVPTIIEVAIATRKKMRGKYIICTVCKNNKAKYCPVWRSICKRLPKVDARITSIIAEAMSEKPCLMISGTSRHGI